MPSSTRRKTANQFTGCIRGAFETVAAVLLIGPINQTQGARTRGAFETVAAVHQNGATVRANMVSGFLTALQSALLD